LKSPFQIQKKIYTGVCSGYVSSLSEGSEIFGFRQDLVTTFRLPNQPSVPIIMVGAGTGVAPFRAFLYERRFQINQIKKKTPSFVPGICVLFFGCRHPDMDYIYEEEYKEFLSDGTLTHLYVGFSRVPNKPKEYVQDLIRKNSSQVWNLIDTMSATVFVCGSGRGMAKEVRKTFAEIAANSNRSNKTPEFGENYLAGLKEKHSYLEDVWG